MTNLTNEEMEALELFRNEQKKQQEFEAEQKRLQIEREQEQKRIADEEANKERAIHNEMIKALSQADVDNVLNYTQDILTINASFTLGNTEIKIRTMEHITYTGRSSSNKGKIKYLISGECNNWKNSFYINPKSVIKKVLKIKEQRDATMIKEQRERDAMNIALRHFKEKYPHAEVSHVDAVLVNRGSVYQRDIPKHILVEYNGNKLRIRYSFNNDSLSYYTYDRVISTNNADLVDQLIMEERPVNTEGGSL